MSHIRLVYTNEKKRNNARRKREVFDKLTAPATIVVGIMVLSLLLMAEVVAYNIVHAKQTVKVSK